MGILETDLRSSCTRAGPQDVAVFSQIEAVIHEESAKTPRIMVVDPSIDCSCPYSPICIERRYLQEHRLLPGSIYHGQPSVFYTSFQDSRSQNRTTLHDPFYLLDLGCPMARTRIPGCPCIHNDYMRQCNRFRL